MKSSLEEINYSICGVEKLLKRDKTFRKKDKYLLIRKYFKMFAVFEILEQI